MGRFYLAFSVGPTLPRMCPFVSSFRILVVFVPTFESSSIYSSLHPSFHLSIFLSIGVLGGSSEVRLGDTKAKQTRIDITPKELLEKGTRPPVGTISQEWTSHSREPEKNVHSSFRVVHCSRWKR